MKVGFSQSPFRSATVVCLVFLGAACFATLASHAGSAGQSRPRRTDNNDSQTSSQPGAGAVQQPSPTPAATPVLTGPGSRIAPQLGAPPPPPKLKPKPTPTPDPVGAAISDEDRIKIDTDLVTLNIRVIDRNNRPVNDVTQDQFRILEDGVPQRIFSFTREEVPVTYGLAVDTSGSLRSQLQQVIDAAKTIINSNKRGDETFLERFVASDNITTIQDFTASRDALIDGLDQLYVEGGQTAVVDGVLLAAEHVAEYRKGNDEDHRRRALIVITDGEDRNSYYTEAQLFQRLREEDVQIYIIGFVNELDSEKTFIRKSPKDKAVALINKMAVDTGGRAFFPTSLAELPQIANEIVRAMRMQYVVSYDPSNKVHDGSYHAIKVTVADEPGKDHRIALTRPGRTAIREGAPRGTNNNARQPATNPNRKTP